MKKRLLLFLASAFIAVTAFAQVKTVVVPLKGEKWWTGLVAHGTQMPLKDGYKVDATASCFANQVQPLILSDRGRFVWIDDPYKLQVKGDSIIIDTQKALRVEEGGKTFKEAYLCAQNHYFPASGKMPPVEFFAAPQYNTWIELIYDQNQKDILTYARSIVDNGFPVGVLMIDDNWQEDYGTWTFKRGLFPDPKAMIDTLHKMGFKVMLWVSPHVSPDSETFRALEKEKVFIQTPAGKTAILPWWNGYSAMFDFTNPLAVERFQDPLKKLQQEYGIDGFKFDAGDPKSYAGQYKFYKPDGTGHDQSYRYAQICLDYPFNEYRCTWKMGNEPLVQRLHDKRHNWKDVQSLVPNMLATTLGGYPYACPDMIGGGAFADFLDKSKIDQELVVRSAQIQALMPMMQFSLSPWTALDAEKLAIVKEAVALRMKLAPYIIELAENAAKTGEPIIRYMEYEYPNKGYADVIDQFMLGSKYLVAPVQEKGAVSRTVLLPAGKWKSWQGQILRGGKAYTFDVTLNDLPYFERMK